MSIDLQAVMRGCPAKPLHGSAVFPAMGYGVVWSGRIEPWAGEIGSPLSFSPPRWVSVGPQGKSFNLSVPGGLHLQIRPPLFSSCPVWVVLGASTHHTQVVYGCQEAKYCEDIKHCCLICPGGEEGIEDPAHCVTVSGSLNGIWIERWWMLLDCLFLSLSN